MMATTHILVGMFVGAVVSMVTPISLPLAVAVGAVGGVMPDLDMALAHRRSLHFPVYGTVIAGGMLVLLVLLPSTATAALFIGCAAFAIHSTMDIFGGSLGLRPWENNDTRAVYDHVRGQWIQVRDSGPSYDGSVGDLLLALTLAAVLAFMLGFSAASIAVLGPLVIISVVYTVVRKRIVEVGVWAVQNLPEQLARFVPVDEEKARSDSVRR